MRDYRDAVAISIHAPREGGDQAARALLREAAFQSTPPARGATVKGL